MDPVIKHVSRKYDDDHRVRVAPGVNHRGGRAACAECGRAVRAQWTGDGFARSVLRVEEAS